MNVPNELLAPATERLAWALIHSLWQGAAIVLVLALILRALRGYSAAVRHAVCLLALLTMLTTALVTAALVSPRGDSQPAALVQNTAPAQPTAFANNSDRPSAIQEPTGALRGAPLLSNQVASRSAKPAASWRERLAPMLPWIAGAWFFGVVLLSIRHCGGWWRVHTLRRSSLAIGGEIQRAFDRLVTRFGLRRAVRLVQTAHALTPMLTGVLKPMIILPARVLTGLGPAEIEAILAHELAHLVRRDAWSNLAQIIIETVLFYHPAVWWISRRARLEREHAADDLALQVCADRRVYAGALVRLAELEIEPAFALAATGGHLLNRVRRILTPQPVESAPSSLSFGVPAAIAALALSTLSPGTGAQDSQKSKTPATAADSKQTPEGQAAAASKHAESWIADAFQLEDATKRAAAIEGIRNAMSSADGDEVRAGVKAFVRLGPIEFDKASFRPIIRTLLTSQDAATRSAAASAFTLAGVEPEDLPRIFALADDPASEVRDNLTYVIVQVTKYDLTGKPASDAILKLMQKLPRDSRSVAHALWGSKFSPEIEAKVLEYCRDMSGFGVGYTFFYGALSTQANKSEASVKRLIEILADQDTTNKAGRAAWGLRQGVSRAQFPLVADAMVRVIEARSDGYLRNGALDCLRSYGTAQQAPALKAILAKPGVTGEFRKSLEELLAGIESRPVIKAEQAASTAAAPATSPAPQATEKPEIEVQWEGKWWPATVLKKEGDRTQIHYVGYDSQWNEWVTNERIRPLNAGTNPEDAASAAAAERAARLVEKNRRAARTRAAQDVQTYNREQLSEIETLYQVANTKGKRTEEARANLKLLLEKYDKANRTGCGVLYLGQGSVGDERLTYLTTAVEKYSDCYYFNGCQVGGYGRYVLALTLWDRGDKDKARALLGELKTTYKDATDHSGRPMGEVAEAVEKELERTQ